MPKPKKNRDREPWLIAADILLLLVLALFIFSMFLWDNDEISADSSSVKTLKVFVTVEDDYFKDLYQQEGKGNPIRVRFTGEEDSFGTIEWIEGNTYLLRCDMEFVTASRYYHDVWELYDVRVLCGTPLLLHSELADFTATVITVPSTELVTGEITSVGTDDGTFSSNGENQTVEPMGEPSEESTKEIGDGK